MLRRFNSRLHYLQILLHQLLFTLLPSRSPLYPPLFCLLLCHHDPHTRRLHYPFFLFLPYRLRYLHRLWRLILFKKA